MDGDEVFFMSAAAVVGIIGFFRWYRDLGRAWLVNRRPPLLFFLSITPLVCLALLDMVLTRWSDPQVRNDDRYIGLFLAGGAAFLAIFYFIMPVLGLSISLDVMNQRNPAVALTAIGGMFAVNFAY